MKKCNKCGIEKTFSEFYKNCRNKDGFECVCKVCTNLRNKEWRNQNKEKRNESHKKWRSKNPDANKNSKRRYYKKHYKRERHRSWERQGILNFSYEDYETLLESQNNCCLICGVSEETLNRPLAVDHCHTTGRVRGLLCDKCNFRVGVIESIENLGIYTKYISDDI